MTVTAVVAIIALLGGGVGFAAEGALPGDALYAIKTQVNEPVRGVFSVSAESKAGWETRKAERRVEEAALLAADGRADAEAYATVRERFDAHADRAEEIIARVEERAGEEVAARLATNLEASLRAHEEILMRLESRVATSTRAEVGEVEERVRARAQTAAELRARLNASVAADASVEAPIPQEAAEGRIEAAAQFIAVTQTRLEARADDLGAEVANRANANLDRAEAALANARASAEAEAYAEAFAQASTAMRLAQEARVFIEAGARINIGSIRLEVPGQRPEQSANRGDQSQDGSGEPVFCTQEARQCPDGSYVGRTGPNCEFAACPGSGSGGGVEAEAGVEVEGGVEAGDSGAGVEGSGEVDFQFGY